MKKQQKSGSLKLDLQFFGNKKRWSEYDVEYPGTDKKYHIADGARVLGQEIFAGKDTSNKIREVTRLRLADAYGGDPDDWQKCKGHTVIDCDGEEVKAEIHWYQEESAGKVELKIKRWEE